MTGEWSDCEGGAGAGAAGGNATTDAEADAEADADADADAGTCPIMKIRSVFYSFYVVSRS